MELTSKQRAQLRGLANSLDTILQVGKDGIGDNLIKQADDAWRRGNSSRAGFWRIISNMTPVPLPRLWLRLPAAR